ncbi:UNVERIFIED_CONTAM: hypothetical protein Slati_3542200, partial [Sesamum latifolium]
SKSATGGPRGGSIFGNFGSLGEDVRQEVEEQTSRWRGGGSRERSKESGKDNEACNSDSADSNMAGVKVQKESDAHEEQRGVCVEESGEISQGVDQIELVPSTHQERQRDKQMLGTSLEAGDEGADLGLVQGLRAPWTVRKLQELVRLHNPCLVFLSETKCSSRRGEMLKEKMNYFGLVVPSRGRSEGLFLLWRKDVEVWIQSFSNHHIDATVREDERSAWCQFTGFYGHPDAAQCRSTWSLLRILSKQSQRPWLCMGDLNEILSQHEKQGVNLRAHWQISAFRECLSDCNLQDLGCSGSSYTWCNHRESPHTVRERLDRACSNEGWTALFPTAVIAHLHEACFDHAALLLTTEGLYGGKQASMGGSGKHGLDFSFDSKISNCSRELTAWNKSGFGNISKRIREIEETLNAGAHKDINSTIRKHNAALRSGLEELLEREEVLWKQRGKALWLKEGTGILPFLTLVHLNRNNEKS